MDWKPSACFTNTEGLKETCKGEKSQFLDPAVQGCTADRRGLPISGRSRYHSWQGGSVILSRFTCALAPIRSFLQVILAGLWTTVHSRPAGPFARWGSSPLRQEIGSTSSPVHQLGKIFKCLGKELSPQSILEFACGRSAFGDAVHSSRYRPLVNNVHIVAFYAWPRCVVTLIAIRP